jgi:hypothetical protein
MKPFLLIWICILVSAVGYFMPKKVVSSTTESIKTSEKQNEVSTIEPYSFVDTIKKMGMEISYYMIEFYPPAGPAELNTPYEDLLEGIDKSVWNDLNQITA